MIPDNLTIYTQGSLALIAMDGCTDLGKLVDMHIKEERIGQIQPESYIVPVDQIRFSNGEGKAKIEESVRGKDVYILCDIGNHSVTYKMYGHTNFKSPDEHYSDIKRVLSAIAGKSKRTTVIMPLLYASRQDRRKSRESLDCAMALQELERMGVKDIITFDVHNSAVQNAIPLCSFENLYATYEIVKTFINDEEEISMDNNDLLVISPDTGAMDRAIYYSNVLGIDVGLFYKRIYYTRVVNGKNPIVQHEYLGRNVKGQNIIIIDDMISSGESVIDIVLELKKREAKHIFVATTFAFFTEGSDSFTKLYEQGILNRVYSTNLTYVPNNIKQMEWYREVDMSKYLASVIDSLNHNYSIEPLIDATEQLKAFIKENRTR